MVEKDLREEAEERADEILGFHIHLSVYLVVNLIIFLVWLLVALFTGTWFPWFIFPLIGWGIGIFFHGMGVYRYGDLEHRKRQLYEKELEKLKKERASKTGTPESAEKEDPSGGSPPPPQPPTGD